MQKVAREVRSRRRRKKGGVLARNPPSPSTNFPPSLAPSPSFSDEATRYPREVDQSKTDGFEPAEPKRQGVRPSLASLLALARFRLVELLLELTLSCSRPAFRVLRAPANRAFVQGPSLLFACLRARWEGVVLQQGGWVVTKPRTAPDLFPFPRLWHLAGYPGLPEPDPTRDVRPRAVASGVRFKLSLPGAAGRQPVCADALSSCLCLPPPRSLNSWFAQTDQTVELRTNGKPLKAEWLRISLIKTETLPKEGPSSSFAFPTGLLRRG